MTTRTSPNNAELTELREQVSRLLAEKELLQTELEARHRRELDDQRDELSRELVRRTYRIGELERKLHETGRVYESTLSWKITRPIRSIRALIVKLVKLLRR